MATTWITGATGAVGSALAKRLVARGERVVLTARGVAALDALVDQLGANALALPGDATDSAAMRVVVEQATQHVGPVTGVAHCVGSILLRPLHSTSDADMQSVMALNFFSAWNVLREFVGAAIKHKHGGSAVMIGTVATRSGFPNHEAVASAKAAVAALAGSAAATYADKGIRINCVHPGLTVSKMSTRFTGTEQAIERMAKLNPLGRVGTGDDTAALIAFLLSDEAGWITGQQISVDGGHGALQMTPKA